MAWSPPVLSIICRLFLFFSPSSFSAAFPLSHLTPSFPKSQLRTREPRSTASQACSCLILHFDPFQPIHSLSPAPRTRPRAFLNLKMFLDLAAYFLYFCFSFLLQRGKDFSDFNSSPILPSWKSHSGFSHSSLWFPPNRFRSSCLFLVLLCSRWPVQHRPPTDSPSHLCPLGMSFSPAILFYSPICCQGFGHTPHKKKKTALKFASLVLEFLQMSALCIPFYTHLLKFITFAPTLGSALGFFPVGLQ